MPEHPRILVKGPFKNCVTLFLMFSIESGGVAPPLSPLSNVFANPSPVIDAPLETVGDGFEVSCLYASRKATL